MRRHTFRSEQQLAAVVVAWLQAAGWEVYQEVSSLEGVADIVATQGGLVWVIEAKLTTGLDVLEQAARWKPWAHQASIATPTRNRFAYQVARKLGVGALLVGPGDIEEAVEAPLFRRAQADKLRATLHEEHKTFAPAGNATGARSTSFGRTCRAVASYVQRNPGVSLKQLLDEVETHYTSKSSARASLARWIDAGKVAGVRLERDGKALRLLPAEVAGG